MEEKTLAKSYVYEGDVVNLREDKAQIDDGQIVDRVVVEHPGGVGIALEDEDGKFFFVKQYRYAQSEVTLEDDLDDNIKKDKIQNMLNNVIKASSYFNGYDIKVSIKSYWKDKK